MITSPPVRYTGSKWRIAPWLLSYIPDHICYCEPFFGGGAMLFRKKPSQMEVVNDINTEVINFFDVLRDRTDELIRAITLTPMHRGELLRACTPHTDALERARRFYIRAWQSYTAGEAIKSRGWRIEILERRSGEDWEKQDRLFAVAHRLRSVAFESKPALEILESYDTPETVFYCDPPYVASTRENEDYPNEMTDADHIALSEALHSIKGMALISGYDSALYRELYADWQCVTKEARTVNNVKRVEHLWINKAAQARQAQKRLF